MDDQTEGVLTFSSIEDSCLSLSPIVEMDESSLSENMESQDDFNKSRMVEAKLLNLETTMENLEYRLPQPETPPETLRERLNSLQSEFEELKEFTDLEKQVIHSECIPREKVRLLEEEFTSLNEKVQHLMYENSEYKWKLEIEENNKTKLESELAKVLNLHNESMILIGHMKQKLQEDVEGILPMHKNVLFPHSSFLGICENLEEVSHFQNVEPLLNYLRDLNDLIKIVLDNENKLKDQKNNLQSEVFELNNKIEGLNGEIAEYQQNFISVKSISRHFNDKLTNIDKELREISMDLSASKDKLIEKEMINDILEIKTCKLQSEIDNAQGKIISIVGTLESFLNSFDADSKNSFVVYKDIKELEYNFKYSHNLHGISCTLDILMQIFQKLQKELKFQHEECIQLKLNNKQLDIHLRKFEEEAHQRKLEVEFLEKEVFQQIPDRLLELENCLNRKDNENLSLQNSLLLASGKIDELSNKLSETKVEIEHINVVLQKTNLEKTILENEILKLKDRVTIDDIQTHIILAIQFVEQLINTWDEKSDIGDLISAFQGNEHIHNLTNMMLNSQTQAILNGAVMSCKLKLLLHDKFLCSKLMKFKNDIDLMESDNKKLRLEVNTLDLFVREGISNRINNLEKHLCFTDQENLLNKSKMYKCDEDIFNSLFISEEERQNKDTTTLKALNNINVKLQKEITNLNKITESDVTEKTVHDLNEIENRIDTWDCSEKIQISEFTQLINEKLLKYCDNHQYSKLKVDVCRIVNKIEEKFLELVDENFQLRQTGKLLSDCVDDYKNKQEMFSSTIKDIEFKDCNLKERNVLENNCYGIKSGNEKSEDIKAIKKIMILEITSLDKTEDEESLMFDSLESIFSKLMQIVMKKQQEMIYSIEKQQKEEVHSFEQRIEQLNNKFKSQDSWTSALESENEKMNSELSALKSLNNTFDFKLKALSNELHKKNSEIDLMKSRILELTTDNNTLMSNLDTTNELVSKLKHSNSSMKKDIEKLNEENVDKSDIIKQLEFKLTSAFVDKQENTNSKCNILYSNLMLPSAKADPNMVRGNQMHDDEPNSVILEGCPDLIKIQKEKISDLETGVSVMLRKDVTLVNNLLKKNNSKVPLSVLLSRCHDKLDVLKDIVLTISSKISELEMSHVNELQSIQTTLEYKTKEMHDLKLSISKLYRDLVPDNIRKRKAEMIDDSFHQFSVPSLMNELDQIKSECLTDRSEEIEQSAKMGQHVVQYLRDVVQTVIDENHNMAKLIHDLRKSIECEQQKSDKLKQKAKIISTEKNVLAVEKSLLENEMKNLKLELYKIKKEIFSEIDMSFPDNSHINEKIGYINKILKQYSDDQKLYSDDLRFFGFQFELMLSYIRSLEYKQCFTAQQKENLTKENAILKGQLSNMNLEINMFINKFMLKSPFTVQSLNQALEVTSHIFTEYKALKENCAKQALEGKCKQEKILQQQTELASLDKQNTSLKFELAKCEDSIRILRSELRTVRSKIHRRESTGEFAETKKEKTSIEVQTEATCCKRLQKSITEQKEKMDILSAKLTKSEQLLRSSVTNNPYNKQVAHLEAALSQAKERIGNLHTSLKQQENNNQELVEALKRHESCQERLLEAKKKIEKLEYLRRNKWLSK